MSKATLHLIIGAAFLLLALSMLAVWVFMPQLLPYFENLWRLMGRPEASTRAAYSLFLLAFMLLASSKILYRM